MKIFNGICCAPTITCVGIITMAFLLLLKVNLHPQNWVLLIDSPGRYSSLGISSSTFLNNFSEYLLRLYRSMERLYGRVYKMEGFYKSLGISLVHNLLHLLYFLNNLMREKISDDHITGIGLSSFLSHRQEWH